MDKWDLGRTRGRFRRKGTEAGIGERQEGGRVSLVHLDHKGLECQAKGLDLANVFIFHLTHSVRIFEDAEFTH